MWVQHVVCLVVVKKIRKIRSHDQNDGEPNLYMSSKDVRDHQNASRVLALAGEVADPLRLRCEGCGFYYGKLCLAPANGGPRIMAHLRLMLASLVVVGWSRNLFVFFLTF
jgi:hypothetical protein